MFFFCFFFFLNKTIKKNPEIKKKKQQKTLFFLCEQTRYYFFFAVVSFWFILVSQFKKKKKKIKKNLKKKLHFVCSFKESTRVLYSEKINESICCRVHRIEQRPTQRILIFHLFFFSWLILKKPYCFFFFNKDRERESVCWGEGLRAFIFPTFEKKNKTLFCSFSMALWLISSWISLGTLKKLIEDVR